MNANRMYQSVRCWTAGVGLAFYKGAVSPALHAIAPGACRFQPTCSEYAALALSQHGFLRGGLMAFGRLLRCHPLCRGGFDPVPAKPGCSHMRESGRAIPCVAQTENR